MSEAETLETATSLEVDGADSMAIARAVKRRQRLADLKELVLACRDKFDDRFDQVLDEIFNDGTRKEKFVAIRWLADRGWGKPEERVVIEGEEGSFDSIMTKIARNKAEALRKAGAITAEVLEEAVGGSDKNDS